MDFEFAFRSDAKKAEEMYGPRDKEYTLLGVEFVEDNPKSNIQVIVSI